MASFIVAIICMIAGSYYMMRAWDELKTKQLEDRRMFNELLSQIKGLRQDLTNKKEGEDGE